MIPHTVPPHSSHAAPPTQLPHTAAPYSSPQSPTEFPPPQSWESVKPTGAGEESGPIRGREECAQCDGTNEYTLPAHMQRWGLSHAFDCCHLTACSDTQCNICTQRLQLHMCVGCNVRLTVNNQPTNHITLTCGSSPPSLQTRQGVCCRGTQRMHKR